MKQKFVYSNDISVKNVYFQGGIKAVMWTDTFQSMMMFIALLAVLIKGTIDAGGIQEVMVANNNQSRLEFFK